MGFMPPLELSAVFLLVEEIPRLIMFIKIDKFNFHLCKSSHFKRIKCSAWRKFRLSRNASGAAMPHTIPPDQA